MEHELTKPGVAVAGIGGFASAHHTFLEELEKEGRLRVVATCDPRAEALREFREKRNFSTRGIQVVPGFADLLDTGCDWLTVATPIALHGSMHAACVERRIPCYLEKPPTLDPFELEEMIACEAAAEKQTQVGFNYVYQPERLALKKRLLSGEFGRVIRVGLCGAWQRTDAYYARNGWVGGLKRDGTFLLDSCLGNAMSHHVHNVLFLAGVKSPASWAECLAVEAQLYRARPIEGADTIFLKGELASSVEFRIALSHACQEIGLTEETVVCENAVIRIRPPHEIQIFRSGKPAESLPLTLRTHIKENLRHYGEYVAGAPHKIMSTLSDCRPFVHLNALAYVSAGRIANVPASLVDRVTGADATSSGWRIREIETRLAQFVETGDFSTLSDLSGQPRQPDRVRPEDLVRLGSTVEAMRQAVVPRTG